MHPSIGDEIEDLASRLGPRADRRTGEFGEVGRQDVRPEQVVALPGERSCGLGVSIRPEFDERAPGGPTGGHAGAEVAPIEHRPQVGSAQVHQCQRRQLSTRRPSTEFLVGELVLGAIGGEDRGGGVVAFGHGRDRGACDQCDFADRRAHRRRFVDREVGPAPRRGGFSGCEGDQDTGAERADERVAVARADRQVDRVGHRPKRRFG